MIGLAPGIGIWLVSGITDMRKYALNIVMRTTRRRTRVRATRGAFNAVHNGKWFWRISAWQAACLAP
ncbi:MAG: hypothetical protein JWO80_5889 [Bryobacterales bacterium]|nr:hypothetical protein [Bryobacterales bacterium]